MLHSGHKSPKPCLVIWSLYYSCSLQESETLKMLGAGDRNRGDYSAQTCQFMEVGTDAKEKTSSRVIHMLAGRTEPGLFPAVFWPWKSTNGQAAFWSYRSISYKRLQAPKGQDYVLFTFFLPRYRWCLPYIRPLAYICWTNEWIHGIEHKII